MLCELENRHQDNPRWLGVVVTILPLVLAAFLVWYFPPGTRANRAPQPPHPSAALAHVGGLEQQSRRLP